MLKQKNVYVVLFIFVSAFLFSQVAADPSDFFYSDLIRWEAKSLVTNLPAVRPYPLQIVKKILETVIEKGDKTQQEIAQNHYDRFFGRSLSVGGKSEAVIDTEKSRKQLSLAIALDVNHFIEENLSISGSFEGWAVNKIHSQEILPVMYVSEKDLIEDNSKVGPFYILPSMNTSVCYGTTEYYFNTGLMRGSFGPIHENGVVLGTQAFHTGQFTFVADKDIWGFTSSLFSLVATSALSNSGDPDTQFYAGKFLALHSLNFKPFPWFEIGLFESVLYGNRFEPLYLIPFSVFFISQALVGYEDNSWLGGMFTVKPIPGLKIDGVLYADDISFKDIVTFKKEQKWRIAGQLATLYSPVKSGLLNLLSIDYTMVTPFAYSHKEGEYYDFYAPNHLNYLHAGTPIGASLEPNSDRLNLQVSVTPLEKLDVTFIGTLIRHGNINENLEQKWIREYVSSTIPYVTDGSIKNASATKVGHVFNYSSPFLAQDTLQYIFQTGFDVKCRLPVLKTGGYMLFKLGYRFEYNANSGINNQIYSYDPILAPNLTDPNNPVYATDPQKDASAASQLEAWRSAATGGKVNNYISAGFEYFF
ncbi:MAG TPA: hypothetical protein VJ861_13090 [Treponemataceae bacterium]|nr:hypothetical protein [Treponemataceae bacterium]